jgi:glutamate-5-semialdehyde dehydrogenase
MDAREIVEGLALSARTAARTLVATTGEQRRQALLAIADEIDARTDEIIAANSRDIDRAKADSMHPQMQDRLLLTRERIAGIASGARQVAALADPLGRVLKKSTLPNGLELEQMTVPFGVIGMVYEARPNVTVDAAVILLMSGNAALLRGSSTADASNKVLIDVMKSALSKTAISPDVLQLVPSDDRATVQALLTARGKVDLVIPRGSAALIRMVVDEATVPTIETGAGVCHVYVDASADLAKALPIVMNSKTHRPSVCNAAETVLVHKSVAEKFLPALLTSLHSAGVLLHCDQAAESVAQSLAIDVTRATEQNWGTEYGVLEMNVGVVDSLESAIDHIATFGTQHTEAIVTEDKESARRW